MVEYKPILKVFSCAQPQRENREKKMILEKLEVGAYAANCYIIGDESSKEGLIIDPGAEANQISRKIKDLGLKVKYIALTHGHMDHVGALKEIKEITHARVAIHAD